MANDSDVLKRVYVQLISLRNNLPNDHPNNNMEWDSVNLYNELLSKLEAIGIDISDFKLPGEMLSNERIQISYSPIETEESGRSNVRYGFFKTKLDSLLGYFEITDGKTQIGFRNSTNEDS